MINWLKNLFHSRDKPKASNSFANSFNSFGSFLNSGFFGNSTTSGKLVNEQTAMQVTAVYACVRILSETIAGLPLQVYKATQTGKEKATFHPLYRLLHDEPNPEMTSFVFRETLMSHLLLWGNAYSQILRNGKGEIIALYPLFPSQMDVKRANNGKIYYVYTKTSDLIDTGVRIRGSNRGNSSSSGSNGKPIGWQINLKASDVLHIPGLGFDGLVGYSPISMSKNAIGMALACEEYGSKFFANSASPSGVLEHPGSLKNPDRIRESWESLFKGSANSHRVAVLEEGLQFKQIGINPNEAQFLETRKFQINEIARIFRIPPHMVGDLEKSSFSNIEQQSLEYVKYTLDPWVVRWEQSIQKSLFTENEKSDYFVKFNVDGLLRGDYQSRMKGYATGIQNGFMSPNDVRNLENLDLIPDEKGGNFYLVNGNMTKLEDAGKWKGKYEEVIEVDEEDKDRDRGGRNEDENDEDSTNERKQ
jgi:phage portal protein BeeE